MRKWLPLLCGLLVAPVAYAKQNTHPHAKPHADQVLKKLAPTEIADVKKAKPAEREQTLCLALGIYHEARSETVDGQRAVGNVILNRVKTKGRTICQTLLEHRQFASTVQNTPYETQSWQSVQEQAVALQTNPQDNTDGATMFYNRKLAHPTWAKTGIETTRIGDHVFMRLGSGERSSENTKPLPPPVEPLAPGTKW